MEKLSEMDSQQRVKQKDIMPNRAVGLHVHHNQKAKYQSQGKDVGKRGGKETCNDMLLHRDMCLTHAS